MPNIVGRGKTDRQVVRDVIGTQAFSRDQGLGKIESQLISRRTECQKSRKILAVGRAIWMRKRAPVAGKIDFEWLIVLAAKFIAFPIIQKIPTFSGIAGYTTLLVPIADPARVVVIVVSACHELSRGLRKPKGFARMARHGHRAAVFHRDRENL